MQLMKAYLLVILAAWSNCDDTEKSTSIVSHKSRRIPLKPFSTRITKKSGSEAMKNVINGKWSLNDIFNSYPVWNKLRTLKEYNRYQAYDRNFQANILLPFYYFLRYSNKSSKSHLSIISAFRDMTNTQLEALFYGSYGISPICHHDLLKHPSFFPILNFLKKRVQIDLSFSCFHPISGSLPLLERILNFFLDLGTLKRLRLSPKETNTLAQLRNIDYDNKDYNGLVMSLAKPRRNQITDNILFKGSLLTLEEVENYFYYQRRSCHVVDDLGNSPLQAALLHPNFAITRFYLTYPKCKHVLDHYNYEGNNALMHLLDNLPFTGEIEKVTYSGSVKPGVQDSTHSAAYYLVKRMLPKKKGQFNILNIHDETTYDLALKTKSLAIIHLIITHDSPSQNTMEKLIKKAFTMNNIEIMAYLLFFHCGDRFKDIIAQYVASIDAMQNIEKHTSANSFYIHFKSLVADELSPRQFVERVLFNKKETKDPMNALFAVMTDAIEKDNLNLLTLALQYYNHHQELKEEVSNTEAKWDELISECIGTQKRAMLWLLIEMGHRTNKAANTNILSTWEGFDSPQLNECFDEEGKLAVMSEFSGVNFDTITEFLMKGVSPAFIYNTLIRPLVDQSPYSFREDGLATLVQYGLSPNISLNKDQMGAVSVASSSKFLPIYLKAGVNITYAPSGKYRSNNIFRDFANFTEYGPLQLLMVLEHGFKPRSFAIGFNRVFHAIASLMDRFSNQQGCNALQKFLIEKKIITFDPSIDGIDVRKCIQ